MKVLIRADASVQIGTGHVMRCLCLAQQWRGEGAEVYFAMRAHQGHLMDTLRQQGFTVGVLPFGESHSVHTVNGMEGDSNYMEWLGASWQEDAQASTAYARGIELGEGDWIVVDHYALDQRWETQMSLLGARVMVIDDLANRPHHCHLLLDQNLGRTKDPYLQCVPPACTILAGAAYALLRPEFQQSRQDSLLRRAQTAPPLRVMVTMGGVDRRNLTASVLAAMQDCSNGIGHVDVVVGSAYAGEAELSRLRSNLPFGISVHVNTTQMAKIMTLCDLAIGAAGSSAWERCCLGLPTVMVLQAENQRPGAMALQAVQGLPCVLEPEQIPSALPRMVSELLVPGCLPLLASRCAQVTDGMGVQRVLTELKAHHE